MHIWLQFKSPHKACLQQPKISLCVEKSVCIVLTLIIVITRNQHCENKKKPSARIVIFNYCIVIGCFGPSGLG